MILELSIKINTPYCINLPENVNFPMATVASVFQGVNALRLSKTALRKEEHIYFKDGEKVRKWPSRNKRSHSN